MERAPSLRYFRAPIAAVLVLLSVGIAAPATAEPSPQNEAPSSGGLLPIPASEEEPQRRGQATDGVAIQGPENVDEALQLLRSIDEARAVAQSISATLSSARVELQAAIALEEMALLAATEAQEPVRSSTAAIGRLAARSYMTGGLPDWASVLYADTPQEAIEISTFASYMQSVTDSTLSVADRAKSASAVTRTHATRATEDRITAERRVADLERNLIRAQLTISSSTTAYRAFISTPRPQTRVGPDGCPLEVASGTLRGGAESIGVTKLCRKAVAAAPSTQAALAIKAAFSWLGAPYACEGVGRMGPWRFDCSSLVSRAYAQSSGIPVAGTTWAPSTRDMIPWDGVALDPHYVEIPQEDIRAGDLLLYRSCTSPPCSFQHVVMALTDGFILHTNDCGDVAHITRGPGYGPGSNFVVARRVVHIEGESLMSPDISFGESPVDPATFLTKSELEKYLALKKPQEPEPPADEETP